MTGVFVTLINLAYWLIFILIFARVIFSWINPASYQLYEVRRWVFRLTEPMLAPVRRFLPATAGFDLSPMIILIVAWFLRSFLLGLL
jgi:YggT family protein